MSATNVVRLAARGVATSAIRKGSKGTVPNTASYKKIQEWQNVMCRDDGLLVWQKGGFKDKAGYQLTMGLMIMGFIPFSVLLFRMAFPKKKE